jgi:hypothetical protein
MKGDDVVQIKLMNDKSVLQLAGRVGGSAPRIVPSGIAECRVDTVTWS